MAGVTKSVVDVAFSDFVFPRLQKAVEQRTIFLKIAQRADPNDLTGKSIIVKMQVGDSAGIVRVSPTAAATAKVFPAATENTYVEHTIPLTEMLGTVSCSDSDMRRAKSNKNSLVKLLKDEYAALLRSIMQELNRGFYVGTTAAITTVESFTAGSKPATDVATITVASTRGLQPKMVIDFKRSGSDVTNAVDITVVAVTGAKTFTAIVTGTPAAGDIIALKDSYGNGAQGLDQIISATETLQGVTAATGYWWQSTIGGSSSALENFNPLTYSNWMESVLDRADEDTANNLLLLANPYSANAIAWLMLGKRSYVNDSAGNAKFEALWTTFSINEQKIIVDRAATKNRLYAVRKEDLIFGNLGDNLVDLVDGDGATHRLVNDPTTGRPTNAWQMNVTSYCQLATKRRDRHAMYHFYGTDDSNATYASYGGTQL